MSTKKRVYPQADQIPVSNVSNLPSNSTPSPQLNQFEFSQQTQFQSQGPSPPPQGQSQTQQISPQPTQPPSQSTVSPNPDSSSSISSSQVDQVDHLKKHKHLVGYELDPEGLVPMNSLSNSMGQMNIQPQMLSPGSSGQYNQQPQQNSFVEAVATSVSQCPPFFMRMTTNVFPNTTSLLNKCGIPLGCVIHPMAQPTRAEVTHTKIFLSFRIFEFILF